MRAVVCMSAGGPSVLELRTVADPVPRPGQVHIRIWAFGLNRAEMYTRQGHSPGVAFPRILGIECVGSVISAPGTDLRAGQKVAAMMGGMGRDFDGSYAEQTVVPVEHVFPLETDLDWPTLGALPEMYQTVRGSLVVGLGAQSGEQLLIRGGTSSIGLTTLAVARRMGLLVAATTRNAAKAAMLREAGADEVFIDDGHIADAVRERFGGGVDRVLELIGTTTLLDSLKCARVGGVVCMTGILGNAWALDGFQPMGDIPTGVRLTSYSGGSGDITAATLQRFVDDVAAKRVPIRIHHVYRLDEVVEAHRVMEESRAAGKIVVRVDDSLWG